MTGQVLKYFHDNEWEPYISSLTEKPATNLTPNQQIKKMITEGNRGYVTINYKETEQPSQVRDSDGTLLSSRVDMSPHQDWTIKIKESGELWHRTAKIVARINGEYKFNDDGTRAHDVFVNIHHRKPGKKLSVEALMKVANKLNPGDHIKYLKKPLRGYVSQELYDRLIHYYMLVDPSVQSTTSGKNDVLPMQALVKIADNIVDKTRKRNRILPGKQNKLSKTQQNEIDDLKDALSDIANDDKKQLVVEDILDIVTTTDEKRNRTIKKDIAREIRKAARAQEDSEQFFGYVANSYSTAFEDLVALIQGGQVFNDHKATQFVSLDERKVDLDGLIKYAEKLDQRLKKDMNERAGKLYGVRDSSSNG